MRKRAKKLVEECLVISSDSEKVSQNKVYLAKKLGREIMTMEVENQFAKLEAIGPLAGEEKWEVVECLNQGRKNGGSDL